jgi:uncharacterized protein (DUF169 family)
MQTMRPLKQDLSIFKKLELEREPVGIKYEFFKPEGFEKLDKSLALCEMVKETQQREKSFYITADNEDCAGKWALGMVTGPVWGEAGIIGERMGIFQEARANMGGMKHYKTFKHGVINYAVFSKLSQLTFEPDLLVFVGRADQTEIILRANAYSTGDMYESKATPVFQCSWLYTYPYLEQKLNYIMTGLGFGMKAREVYPQGLAIVSVPWNLIPTIAQNMREMQFVLPAWKLGREAWMKEESAILTGVEKSAQDAGLLKK